MPVAIPIRGRSAGRRAASSGVTGEVARALGANRVAIDAALRRVGSLPRSTPIGPIASAAARGSRRLRRARADAASAAAALGAFAAFCEVPGHSSREAGQPTSRPPSSPRRTAISVTAAPT